MDEMAYRGHERCDIDGQSDIASLILPPLGLTHTRTHIPLCCSNSSIALFLSFFLSSALTHEFCLCSLAHFSLLPLLSLTCSSLVTSSRGLVSSHFSVLWLSGGSTALSLAPFISSSAPPVLVCTHQPATHIPIIISQDQTTTTLCEGHRRKDAGEVKINTTQSTQTITPTSVHAERLWATFREVSTTKIRSSARHEIGPHRYFIQR